MKKMPCLFQRDFTDKRKPKLLQTVTPGCEWALAGEGSPTRKRDGTACMVRGGKLFKRYDAKKGKTPPEGFVSCGEPDAVTGHNPGWVEVDDGPECKWHREAWTGLRASGGSRFRPKAELADGTYELCGPRVNGNAEGLTEHEFIRHGSEIVTIVLDGNAPPPGHLGFGLGDGPMEFLGYFLSSFMGEGIVFHHPDGRMCKIRRDDYGLKWPAP